MIIRKIEKEDLATRVLWMNDSRVYSTMHFEVPILLENTIKWFERIQENPDRLDVSIVENNEIVAFGGFTTIDRKVGKAETYLFADPDKQNQGIGTKAKLLMCQYGFETLNLNKLIFVANQDNAQIIRVNEKIGFVLEGRLRKEYLASDGTLIDLLYYGLLRTEWEEIIKRNKND